MCPDHTELAYLTLMVREPQWRPEVAPAGMDQVIYARFLNRPSLH
jgi:hypothetical protein